MNRESMARVLDETALLMELRGENPFKIRAYRNGAETVRRHMDDIVDLAKKNQLDNIEGIGSALREKLHTLATTGHLPLHEELRAQFPSTLFELFDLQGLGPKKVRLLYDKLGIDSIAALKTACESGDLAKLQGFGKKTVDNILHAIAFKEQHANRYHRDEVAKSASSILDFLRNLPAADQVAVAGSFRRACETVGDLDFIVATRQPETITKAFAKAPFATRVLADGKTKTSIVLENGMQCDLRAVHSEQYPFALLYFTGSKDHNVALRSRARKSGWSLNEYGFSPIEEKNDGETADKPPNDITDERSLYQFLGLELIPPALREQRGEIEAAETGTLPRLVEWTDLRGTFHNHTTASDGEASLEEMADAACHLGLEYLGIADHSKASFQANGLDANRLASQLDEIKALNARFEKQGSSFRILSGSEVDILKDGSLDFPDELLAQLDYVVASIHSSFGLTEKDQTQRLIRAMENPHVTMLGHLSGRLLLRRESYAIDVPAILECAAHTRTVIEFNANPWRLDMDWRHWQHARELNILCAINPDAHRVEDLAFLRLGTEVAAKGWLTKKDVLNTRPLARITQFLKTPKNQRQ